MTEAQGLAQPVPPINAKAVLPRTEYVAAGCPLCYWQSEPVPVDPDRVNGQWEACATAGKAYRNHYQVHRPLPTFRTWEAPAPLADLQVEPPPCGCCSDHETAAALHAGDAGERPAETS